MNTPFMKVAKLVDSNGLSQFRASLLDLLLVQTEISPILSDTHRTIRFLQLTLVGVNVENALDRLIPDSTKLGNDQSYEPNPELATHVVESIGSWLNKWHEMDVSAKYAHTVKNPGNLQNLQQIEKSLDGLFRLLVKYVPSDKLDWESDYDYYALNGSNNLELLLNKLKVIYQVTA